ncbi:MAG: hypothetical protein J6Y28_07735 [Acholeplasmatales bacterium]|nr:hypothetical protein [Acholeplasmatales bacterium]
MAKKKSKFKITLIVLVTIFSLFLFGFGLFMVIYNYDIYTVIFGVILIIISLLIGVGDILLIKKWEPKDTLEITYGDNPEIKQLEKEIEEIKKKNNL